MALPLPRPIRGVRLAGQAQGLSQEEVRFTLEQRRHAEEMARREEEDAGLRRSVLGELAEQVGKIEATVQERLEQWQPFLVELALKVAERVVHLALDRGDYNLGPVVGRLLDRARNATTGTGLTVLVNPADLSLVLEFGRSEGFAGDPAIRFDTSPRVERGRCLVQTDEGRLLFDPQEFFAEAAQVVREELVGEMPLP